MAAFYLKVKNFALAISCYCGFAAVVIFCANALNQHYKKIEQQTLHNQLSAHAQVFSNTLQHAANQLYSFDSYLLGKETEIKTNRQFNHLAESYLQGLNFAASFEMLVVFSEQHAAQVSQLAQQSGQFDFRLSLPDTLNEPLLAVLKAAPMTDYGHNIGQVVSIDPNLWLKLSTKQQVRALRWPAEQAQWSLLLNHTKTDNMQIMLGIRLELAKLLEDLYQQVFADHHHHIRVIEKNKEVFNSDWNAQFNLAHLPAAAQLNLNFFGQELELLLYTEASLTPPFITNRMLTILLVSFIAMITGLMVLLYLISLHGRHEKINRLVIERTASLKQANNQLVQSSNQRVQALELKLTAEQKYKKLFLNTQEGLFVLNEADQIIDYNPAFAELLSLPSAQQTHTLSTFIYCSEKYQLWQTSLKQKSQPSLIEWLAKKGDGDTVWLRQSGSWMQQDNHWYYEGRLTDITQIKLFNEQLKYKAEHDNLTDLLNRHRFLDEINHTRSQVKAVYYLIYIDLDRFKLINDTLGHLAGDKLLIEFSRRMTLLMGHYAEIARLGGDEFAVLFNANKLTSPIEILCEDILMQIRRPFIYQQHSLTVSGSLGIRRYSVPCQTLDAEKLLHDADIAMYEAKRAGKDCFSIFSTKIARTVTRKLTIERALQHIDLNTELLLLFQPLFCTHNNKKVIGYEALLRWQHSVLGAISPAEFIPIAEESGKIIPLGLWVCEQALSFFHQIKQNAPHQDVFININVSPIQLEHEGFVGQLIKKVASFGLSPHNINIEITESAMMTEEDRLITPLSYLYEQGFGIHIDDFGTGYSSLARLKALPLSGIKIDRSFIQDIAQCNESLQLVQAICAIADTFNLKVTAEGVETIEQIHILQSLYCQQIQGFYLAKPLNSLDAQLLILNNHRKTA